MFEDQTKRKPQHQPAELLQNATKMLCVIIILHKTLNKLEGLSKHLRYKKKFFLKLCRFTMLTSVNFPINTLAEQEREPGKTDSCFGAFPALRGAGATSNQMVGASGGCDWNRNRQAWHWTAVMVCVAIQHLKFTFCSSDASNGHIQARLHLPTITSTIASSKGDMGNFSASPFSVSLAWYHKLHLPNWQASR